LPGRCNSLIYKIPIKSGVFILAFLLLETRRKKALVYGKIRGKVNPVLKIKRIYAEPSADDGKRILVDRLWPRGIKKNEARIDEWIKDIAPSNELRKWFSHDPSKWQEFKKRYTNELENKSEILKQIRKESKTVVITLLFSAKDVEHNNAVVLKEAIEKEDFKNGC
jgi:uncharacterized protein YeaO (DUF488 family)